jgi:outer membrane usher protein
LPLDVEIRGVREAVIPYARSGAFVDFPVKRSRDAMVILMKPDGTVVPAGARVVVTPGNQQFVVAMRGEVYLMDLQDENRIEVRWKDGRCDLPLPLPPVIGGEAARIGPLTCGAR